MKATIVYNGVIVNLAHIVTMLDLQDEKKNPAKFSVNYIDGRSSDFYFNSTNEDNQNWAKLLYYFVNQMPQALMRDQLLEGEKHIDKAIEYYGQKFPELSLTI